MMGMTVLKPVLNTDKKLRTVYIILDTSIMYPYSFV